MECTIEENCEYILGKKNIMELFGCENNKSLSILKLMYAMKLSLKIGKEYYTTKDNLDIFLNSNMGKTIYI